MTRALITGFPGFIGRRLVKKLLDNSDDLNLTVLVEERMRSVAEELAAPYGDRVEVVVGDISAPGLGLSDPIWDRLTSETDTVYHLAAIYDLAVPAELAQRVNVDGTGNVLDFCEACSDFHRLVYVSTAYVAGDRSDTVYEHELALGQGFKNHYEHTKFQAEVWVRDRMERIPTTILRPAIVVGDSETGETEKFDGPYYLLRSISQVAGFGQRPVAFGHADAPFNVVPVDFVVGALAIAARDEAMAGETLHLVDPEPHSTLELMNAMSREYMGKPTRGHLPAWAVDNALRLGWVRKLFADTPRQSIVYLNHAVSFDTRRAVELLAPHGLKPPNLNEYVGAMVRFFKAHEDDPAYAPKH